MNIGLEIILTWSNGMVEKAYSIIFEKIENIRVFIFIYISFLSPKESWTNYI